MDIKTDIKRDFSDYLPSDFPHLTNELKERAYLELSETETTRTHCLQLLKTLLTDDSLKRLDEDIFLLSYLRAKKFDVKRAFSSIQSYVSAKQKHKELFEYFEFSDIQKTLSGNCIGLLPYRDAEGCSLFYFKLGNWNTDENSLGHIIRAATCGLLHSLLYPATQVAGMKIILDFDGFSIRKLSCMTPNYIRLFAEGLQFYLPVRIRGVYTVHEYKALLWAWYVIRPLLSKKVRERFQFCGSNMKTLHKRIPPCLLPKEYDGELPPSDNSEWIHKVSLKSDYIIRMLTTVEKNQS